MRILVIEDDQKLAALIARALTRDQHNVDLFHDGDSGLEAALKGASDVAIIDWMLPGRDGPAICRAIRAARLRTAVMLLTARGQVEDRVAGNPCGSRRLRTMRRRRKQGKGIAMSISYMIKDALEKKGLRSLKDASGVLGISPELLRVILSKGHLPKDKTLGIIANKLGINAPLLILSAHQEKVPAEVKGFFLAPSTSRAVTGQRKFPLSHEQCEYLEKIMTPAEIQLIRKLRQVSDETKAQIFGYVDYMFATKRVYKNNGNGNGNGS